MKHYQFPLLVAEVANCHAGNEAYLLELVSRIARTSAEAVKFQLIIADELLASGHSQLALFRSLEFTDAVWRKAVAKAKSAGKKVAFDIFGDRSLARAAALGADLFKVYASDVDDLAFIRRVMARKRPVYVSTGGAELDEIERVIKLPGGDKLCFLVGFQSFPTPLAEAHLNRIEFLRQRYRCQVGFMDHSDHRQADSSILPCLAVAKGACTVEKHVYLADKKKTYDWQSAVDCRELDRLHGQLLAARTACGPANFRLTALEKEYFRKKRKLAVAARELVPGEKLDRAAVVFKLGEAPDRRTGIYRQEIAKYFGRSFRRRVAKDGVLLKEQFAKG
jgi:N,N'-diacetyllegionaminate synthase